MEYGIRNMEYGIYEIWNIRNMNMKYGIWNIRNMNMWNMKMRYEI